MWLKSALQRSRKSLFGYLRVSIEQRFVRAQNTYRGCHSRQRNDKVPFKKATII